MTLRVWSRVARARGARASLGCRPLRAPPACSPRHRWCESPSHVTRPFSNAKLPTHPRANPQEKFLNSKIKVNGGKAGVLGDIVSIERDDTVIHVTSKTSFSKGYLKYLTKKFLKKQQLRDYIRVISSSKSTYDLRYFTVQNDDEEE